MLLILITNNSEIEASLNNLLVLLYCCVNLILILILIMVGLLFYWTFLKFTAENLIGSKKSLLFWASIPIWDTVENDISISCIVVYNLDLLMEDSFICSHSWTSFKSCSI